MVVLVVCLGKVVHTIGLTYVFMIVMFNVLSAT